MASAVEQVEEVIVTAPVACKNGHDFMELTTGESRTWWLGRRTVIFVTVCRHCGQQSVCWYPKFVDQPLTAGEDGS